jgi:hypothetical protein
VTTVTTLVNVFFGFPLENTLIHMGCTMTPIIRVPWMTYESDSRSEIHGDKIAGAEDIEQTVVDNCLQDFGYK